MMSSCCKVINPMSIFRRNMCNKNGTHQNFMEDGLDIKLEDTVEFTFPIKGGRVIKVYDADTITIASKLPYNESPMYRLSVRLNGIDAPEMKGKGISDEDKERVFEPKFTTKSSGMGLGLPMVKNIVETYDGTITFTTQLNKGTVFKIVLPKK